MKPRIKCQIELKAEERERLQSLLQGGVESVRVIQRAQALRLLGWGWSSPRVGASVGMAPKTVRAMAARYRAGGLERALYDRRRPGAVRRLNGSQAQRIIALVCGPPPEGRARWTVRLITAEAVKRKLAPRVGRETIRVLLERHEVKPWREKKMVWGRTRRSVHRKDGRRSGRV